MFDRLVLRLFKKPLVDNDVFATPSLNQLTVPVSPGVDLQRTLNITNAVRHGVTIELAPGEYPIPGSIYVSRGRNHTTIKGNIIYNHKEQEDS